MMDLKKAAKNCALTLLTGGLYFIAIFVKILFTTPEGQKIVERELKGKVKAFRMEEEIKDKEPMNKIGFITTD